MGAAEALLVALELTRDARDRSSEASALDGLAAVRLRQGLPEDAMSCLRSGLGVARDIGARDVETSLLNGLGEAWLAAGDPARAGTATAPPWSSPRRPARAGPRPIRLAHSRHTPNHPVRNGH